MSDEMGGLVIGFANILIPFVLFANYNFQCQLYNIWSYTKEPHIQI